MHHGRPIVYGLAELIASLNLDQLDPGRSQLVIEWIAMRFLDDDFRLHAGNVRQLLNQLFVIAGENTRQSRLNRGSRARCDERAVAFGKFQHFGDALPCRNLEFRNVHEVATRHGHHGFEFRPKNGAAKHRHRALAVDDGGHAEFVIWISALAKAAHSVASSRCRNFRKEFARR